MDSTNDVAEHSASTDGYTEFEILNHESLSRIVSEVLGECADITQADFQVVASSFEPAESLVAGWEMAKAVAVLVAPWLKHKDAADGDWSMNLFTRDGLWKFPECSA